MDAKHQWVSLGKISREWGLRGQVKCLCFNEASDLFSQVPHLYLRLQKDYQVRKLLSAKEHGKYWLLHFEGIHSPEEAKAYRGVLLALPREELPPLKQGEFYLVDLEGFEVLSPAGKSLGQVQGFQQVGESEVMQVGKNWQESVGVPYEKDFIASTRHPEKQICLTDLAMELFELS
ncbi:MAG: 16S rRNA processing protein RimM [Deltaproteobacteria bacterium]|nr:16S rRNA processing protein RimM [Deltaproteobacteria bacterium]